MDDDKKCKICGCDNCSNRAHISLTERDVKFSQPYFCPFCGRENCKNVLHLIKLCTLPYTELRPKHKFMLYGILVIIMFVAFVINIIIQLLGKS